MNSGRWRLGVFPVLLAYVVFFLAPQAMFLAMSLFSMTGPGMYARPLTGSNFAAIIQQAYLRRALFNTIELAILTAVLSILLAFPLAYRIAQPGRLGRYLLALVIGVMFSSSVALALGWQTLLAPVGGINQLLTAIGFISHPLPISANFTAVVIGSVHGAIPVATLGMLPACEAIQRQQIEASIGLGASHFRTLVDIVIPQVYRSALAMLLIIFATTTSIFTTPALLGGGRVALESLAIQDQLFTLFDYPQTAAIAAVLAAVTIAVMLGAKLITRSASGRTAAHAS